MSIVGIILDAFMNALAGATGLDSVNKPEQFIPTWTEVEKKYISDQPAFKQMLSDYRDEVRTRTTSALLAAAGSDHDSALASAKIFFRTNNPALSLPSSNVSDLSYRLVMKGTSSENDTREAWKLVNGGAPELDAAMGTKAKAVEALAQLRRLDNVCIRWMAATYAAADCQVPVAETLALYRVEGNLQVPASTNSITLGVPTDSLTTPTHVKPSSLRTSVSVRSVSAGWPTAQPVAEWMLQLAGLDHVTVKLSRDSALAPVSQSTFVGNVAGWSSRNWSVHLPGDPITTVPEALVRWNLMESLITAQYGFVDTGTDQRVLQAASPAPGIPAARVATVDDPVVFVGTVLAEGAMFMRKLTTPSDVLGTLPAGQPLAGERLGLQTYGAFSYNLHMGDVMKLAPYNKPQNAHREAGLTSAVAAARRSTKTNAKPLSTLINADAAFKAKVKAFKVPDDTDVTKATEWPIVKAWLTDAAHPERFDALAKFIEKADGEWGSWKAFRGHGSRYRRLLKFYERVAAP